MATDKTRRSEMYDIANQLHDLRSAETEMMKKLLKEFIDDMKERLVKAEGNEIYKLQGGITHLQKVLTMLQMGAVKPMIKES